MKAAKEAAASADAQQLVLASDKHKSPEPMMQSRPLPGQPIAALPAPPPPAPQSLGAAPSLPPMQAMPLPSNANRLSSMLQNVKQKVTRCDGEVRSSIEAPQGPIEGGGALVPSGPARDFTRPPQPGPGVTPQSNIDSNIQTAIKACSEERSNVVQTRQQMQMVKETQNEGDCDVSGHVGKLEIIGTPESASIVQACTDILSRSSQRNEGLCHPR